MIVINSVFAAYEIALASISLSRLHALVGSKKQGAAATLYMAPAAAFLVSTQSTTFS